MRFFIKGFKTIIDEIDLNMNENIVALIGQNGSGKTNILESIKHFFINMKESEIKPQCYESENIDSINTLVRLEDDFSLDDESEIREVFKKNKVVIEKDILRVIEKDINSLIIPFRPKESYFDICQEISNGILKKEIEYMNTIIKKKEYLENEAIYEIDIKELGKIKNISPIPYARLSKCLEDINKIKDLYNKNNYDFHFLANNAIENDIDFNHDITQYGKDKKITNVINFFCSDADKKIKDILTNNNSTKDGNIIVSNTKRKIVDEANKKIKDTFGMFDIYASPQVSFDGNSFKVEVKTKDNFIYNDNIETRLNSSGYKSLFWIILYIEISMQEKNKKIIILADEPDKNLHPFLQKQLICYLESKLKNSHVFFLFSTHSPFLLTNTIEKYIVNRDKKGKTSLLTIDKIKEEEILSAFTLFASEYLAQSITLENLVNLGSIFIDSSNHDDIKEVEAFFDGKIKNSSIKLKICFLNDKDALDNKIIYSLKKSKKDTIIEDFNNNKKIIISKEALQEIKEENNKY